MSNNESRQTHPDRRNPQSSAGRANEFKKKYRVQKIKGPGGDYIQLEFDSGTENSQEPNSDKHGQVRYTGSHSQRKNAQGKPILIEKIKSLFKKGKIILVSGALTLALGMGVVTIQRKYFPTIGQRTNEQLIEYISDPNTSQDELYDIAKYLEEDRS